MGLIDFIIRDNHGRSDRDLLHKILENQYHLEHLVTTKLNIIMGQFEDFTAALDKLDTDIQAVSDEIATILAGTPVGALTADQAASLIARIQGEQTKLEGLEVPAPPAV